MVMTMSACFDELLIAIRDLRAAVAERLQWVVVNARPMSEGHILADRLEDWSTEITAAAIEAEQAGLRGREAAIGHLDLDVSAGALTELHRVIRRAARLFNAELASTSTYATLRSLAEEEATTGWADWADGVSEAIDRCRDPLERIENDIAEAWARWAEIACTVAASRRACARAERGEL
jgi:translation initiation factor 2B subunit (eIF-2B alpha/beta/delta family)